VRTVCEQALTVRSSLRTKDDGGEEDCGGRDDADHDDGGWKEM
jgi:hypothetical protein